MAHSCRHQRCKKFGLQFWVLLSWRPNVDLALPSGNQLKGRGGHLQRSQPQDQAAAVRRLLWLSVVMKCSECSYDMKYLEPICDLNAHHQAALYLSSAVGWGACVRWKKSRPGEKWEIRSLVECLRHSNRRIFPSPPRPPAERFPPRLPLTARGPLIHWFSVGFACACIAGGIALLAK